MNMQLFQCSFMDKLRFPVHILFPHDIAVKSYHCLKNGGVTAKAGAVGIKFRCLAAVSQTK